MNELNEQKCTHKCSITKSEKPPLAATRDGKQASQYMLGTYPKICIYSEQIYCIIFGQPSQAEQPFPAGCYSFTHFYERKGDTMPTAKKLPSRSWRCQVYSHTEDVLQPDGSVKRKRIYKSFTCDLPDKKGKRIAEQMAAEWAAEKETFSRYDRTFGEALDQYIENRSSVLSPATIREYKQIRKRDVQGLMDKKILNITQEDVQEEVNLASLSHSPKTVRNIHGIISAVMRANRPNFALNTQLPKAVRPSLYIPSDSEIQALLSYVSQKDAEMEKAVLLAAFGPMRRGEICALDSDHIDGCTIHVEYSMTQNEKGDWILKAPKSLAGNRRIQFPQFVIDKFSGIEGRIVHLNPTQISHRFPHILSQAGLAPFRFHDLRHYSASIQHALGVKDAYIMERGGWNNDKVLKEVYRHTLSEESQKANEISNGHFEKLYNTKCNTKK